MYTCRPTWLVTKSIRRPGVVAQRCVRFGSGVEHETMVIPTCVDDVLERPFVVAVEARTADRLRRTRNWDVRVVDRDVGLGCERQFVTVERATTRKIPVRMIGEIHRRGLVDLRSVVDLELIPSEFKNGSRLHLAGKPHVARFARVLEQNPTGIAI